jgi:general stress protein YciG
MKKAAGRKGGVRSRLTHGREFYQEIGRRGGRSRRDQIGSEGFSEIGHKGGTRLSRDCAYMAEIGRKGGKARAAARRGDELKV